MQTTVDAKASQSNTYTKDEVDGKPDDAELTASVGTLNTAIDTKQKISLHSLQTYLQTLGVYSITTAQKSGQSTLHRPWASQHRISII